MKKHHISKVLALALLIQIIVIPYALSHLKISQTGFYVKFTNLINTFLREFLGKASFSVGDVFYTLLALYLIFNIVKWVKHFKKQGLTVFYKLLSVASVLYFTFYLFWGFNYAKAPLYKSLKLEMKPVKTVDLIALTTQLIEKTNTLQLKLSKLDSIKVIVPYSKSSLVDEAIISYQNLAKKWPVFTYTHPSIKFSSYSLALSYMGYSGYYNPFSAEAQVNSYLPKVFMAFTACHEMAHQLGFAPEQEANFIGYLACIYSADAFVQYSGYLVALSYTLNNLRQNDIITYKKLTATLHKGVLKNYKENYDFWSAYKNPTTPIFERVYDRFLKVNKQPEGIKSYSGIVKLMVVYHKEYPLKDF
ncbi:MAG: DUF3810 domain-containing protein [Flavobacteriaceae bacterium]|nr:DUF3810 domain-containing protein [Flavobacteriaceae bacterium]